MRTFSNARRLARRTATVTFLTLLALGCKDGSPVAVESRVAHDVPEVSPFVVGEAALALGPDGQFTIAAAPLSPARPEITESRAREIAQAFVTTHARGVRSSLERDHGGAINIDALHVCGRAWYAHSVFDPLSPEVPAVYHRLYGPWWLVTLCGGGERPQVSVAVSAYATELKIANGRLQYPAVSGHELRVLGIPSALSTGLPATPERAVEVAARASGARIAGVPQLVAAPPTEYPQAARWSLRLERNVTLNAREPKGTAITTRHVNDVFVGTSLFSAPNQPQIAHADQPGSLQISFRAPAIGMTREQIAALPTKTAVAVRRPDFPVRYMIAGGK